MIPRYDFYEYVRDNIKDYLPPSFEQADITITRKVKHNDQMVDILLINTGEKVVPNINLDELYGLYQQGYTLGQCTGVAADFFIENQELSAEEKRYVDMVYSYEAVKEKLQIRLCDPEENRQSLQGKVHTRQGVYEATYYVNLMEDGYTGTGFMVTDSLLDLWQINKETLHKDALKADEKRGAFLMELDPLQLLLTDRGFLEQNNLLLHPQKADLGLMRFPGFVLTSTMPRYGAGVILQEDVQEKVGQVVGGNYFLLPSSLHEWIIIPEEMGLPVEEMTAMVRDVNEKEVGVKDRLSDKVLHYDTAGAFLENAVTWEMRAGKAPKKEMSSISRSMQEIVRECARSSGPIFAVEKHTMPLGTMKALQFEASRQGLTQYLDFSQENFDLLCDTRLSECFDLSQDKTKRNDHDAPKRNLEKQENLLIL